MGEDGGDEARRDERVEVGEVKESGLAESGEEVGGCAEGFGGWGGSRGGGEEERG